MLFVLLPAASCPFAVLQLTPTEQSDIRDSLIHRESRCGGRENGQIARD